MNGEIETIKDIGRLSEYLPFLLAIFRSQKYRKLFEEDMTETLFVSRLYEMLSNPSNFIFGRIVNNRLEFFCTTESCYKDKTKQLGWFAY